MAPSDPDLPVEELSTYVNFLHVRHNTYYDKNAQDFYHLVPSAEGLERVRGTNIKLILKLDRYLVEPIPLDECCSHYGIPADECTVNICGFNEGELSELHSIVDPYRDVIEAIYVVNEPYKAANNYTEEFLSELVQQVKDIFPGYPIYINFLGPYYRSLEVPGEYPNIPENIDLIAFDAYFVPLPDQEAWYKQMIGNDIAIIKDRANGRPVIFSSIAFRIDHELPEGPDSRPELYQAQWDYELYLQHDLAGLRWFFYDYKTPIGTWYGASYWPDLIAKHAEIGRKILGPTSSERAFLPLVVKPSVPEPPPPEPPGEITIIRDILYGDIENGDRNLLDLYLPSNPVGRIPVIIWIHGGGLTTGDKGMAGQGLGLVYEGFALVGINYRLIPDAYLPTQIYDAKAAVRWVRANADTYNLDPDNIGVLGGSAGAMIAAGIGTSGDVAALEGDVGDNLGYSSRVQAAIPLAGVYDFFNFFEDMVAWCQVGDMEHYDACYLHYFFGCSLVYESCWEALELGSAISHVSPDDPPFFICIGDADETPQGLEDHINFHNALLAQGVDSTLVIPPGGVHGECYERTYNEILAFFNSHLKQ
jgi:acetyl esterase/lipase